MGTEGAEIIAGQNAVDSRLRATVSMQSAQTPSRTLHRFSTLQEWFNDPAGAAILGPMLQDMVAQPPPRKLYPEPLMTIGANARLWWMHHRAGRDL